MVRSKTEVIAEIERLQAELVEIEKTEQEKITSEKAQLENRLLELENEAKEIREKLTQTEIKPAEEIAPEVKPAKQTSFFG